MVLLWLFIAVLAAVIALAAGRIMYGWYRRRAVINIREALAQFRIQREHLEARFLDLACRRGEPPGWIWEECEFEDGVVLARKRGTNSLRALVRINIFLESIVGGDSGDGGPETAVVAATAIFLLNGDRWMTEGRTVINLDPEEMVERFASELQRVA
jgi:hypothetical protein